MLWATWNDGRTGSVWQRSLEASKRRQARYRLVLRCIASHDWIRLAFGESYRVLNTAAAERCALLMSFVVLDGRWYRGGRSKIRHRRARVGKEGERGQPQVMTFSRHGSELERTCRCEDEDGAIEEDLVLGRRAVVGDIKDRLNDD
jgi:hypothetical protein